ncbi:Hydrogen cyanide synthase subunit HcnC precursor [Planctomycetes bacterium MalM25]|nr:Hydrogen cyanide synthase subunit HcnC precursor [Planctomycetes bacterium MalM25]
MTPNPDVLVIGGGVIGLSVAYQLSRDGLRVTLIDRGQPGREASWAGAGILPPASWYVDHPALDRLAIAATREQAEWSARLSEQTGLDDEYWPCGAIYQATPENAGRLAATFERWRNQGVEVSRDANGWVVPGEAQVRNPRRLQALVAGCRHHGVRIVPAAEVTGLVRTGEEIHRVDTPAGEFSAGAYCLTAGCWTPGLARLAASSAPGKPVRGQMLLLRPEEPTLDRIVHRYPHYAVPRRDGRVLIGATVEEAGFAKETTAEARAHLLQAAAQIDARLGEAPIEAHWSGLRPASADRLPQIGRLPGLQNAWVASGHHRSGLQLAPPTARLISCLIRGEVCELPADPFDPARFAPQPAAAG